MITDKEVLELHDVGARPRCRMELKIVNALLKAIEDNDYTVKIEEYEEEETPDLKKALFNLDEANLYIYKDKICKGWIRLVFGNDGWDLISDYSIRLESLLKPVQEVADNLLNGLE